jgi:hypothetical protein
MLAFTHNSALAVPDYMALFDYDEARLAEGSGSKLLDAYISPSNVNPYAPGPDTPLAAIRAATEAERGDIFARVCALTLARDAGPTPLETRLGRALPYLRGLLTSLRDTRMSLSSAVAAQLIRQDKKVVARGWFEAPPQGVSKAMGDEARTLATAALRAGEPRRDRAFDALLEGFLASFETHCADCDAKELTQALAFAQTCLAALGRDPETFFPARAKVSGLSAADRLLEKWRNELPPPLWRFFAIVGHFEEGTGREWARLTEQMVAQTPAERGAIAERLWRMMEEARLQPEGLPFRFETLICQRGAFSKPRWAGVENWPFDKLWQALLAKRCVFAPEFALKLVSNCNVMQWSDTTSFARSLAAALPRTLEARDAVERRFAQQPCYRAPAVPRALEQQKFILLDALAAAQAGPSLESRAADARAAFEQTLRAEREKAAKALQARASEDPTSFGSLERIRKHAETRLDEHKLIPLFFAAVKLGPVPETWLGLLQEIADDVESERQELVRLAERPSSDFEFRARGAISAREALDAAAAAFGLYMRVTAAEREALLAAEDFAAHAPSGAAPSGKWAKAARELAQAPEAGGVRRILLGFMGRTGFLNIGWVGEMFGTPALRRALVWLLAFHPTEKVAKPLGELATRAFTPSERGPENELIGNACLWALSELAEGGGLPTLARIGARLRYPKTRRRLDALFEAAAAKAGRTRAEVEDEIAPRHGFDEEGVSRFALAGEAGGAEFRLSARGKAEIVWRGEGGKALKAPSPAMKLADAAGLKAAREAAREIETDYGVQAKRVETLYRSTRALGFARWREFYVDHPFVGLIARRLIWRAGDVVGMWRDGGFEDLTGTRHDVEGAKLTLWHPVEAGEAEVLAWRDRLAALGIDQPFRQAWRETYRVTDAERATGHYSNRFASHLVRQHQFMTLARLNDWSCRHRMWQDVANDEPTFVVFPEHGIYAEYWTAGVGGDDPPVADSTAYLYLTTDRVVFHRLNSEAPPNRPAALRGERLSVDEVPPVIFSEILRCCDLFVSVASIARDAQWLDRGRDARHPAWRDGVDAYWRNASEAALQANAQVRRELLARLLPALGVGERLKLDDRRLHVRGVRGAYAIHLGSGAVFHESGRHICIVPAGAPKKLALPYEGDETLALIVSKAMLLLRDDKIADPVILGQL